ncbi:MAG: putative S-adenosylmethionine-dependent methyltransferase [candidate division WS2 bacterium]|uniref:S-adenosylmethionine-dependent methyltransferase n=1 Tax=Psychracetigena formicireducens TaxID=2986056 RepID=A0A9E2BJB7_PSYF1|nr:putative S-adenosylmethionine-dependent methyltransferase [Candidatus Psychracetigena formicireducens]
MQTAERVARHDVANNVIFQRHLVAYNAAETEISGNVLEVGSGDGYGLRILSKKAVNYTAVDKFPTDLSGVGENVQFVQANIPPLPFESNSFDYVVGFQVIEHIDNDKDFCKEIARVLKPGGKLLLTTPNRTMSLTRNPFHIREYLANELHSLMAQTFSKVEVKGVFGNEKVMNYYYTNKKGVERITRWDILDLQHRLPRRMLQIPYDFFNWVNRKALFKQNAGLVSAILASDHFIAPSNGKEFDLFVFAEK